MIKQIIVTNNVIFSSFIRIKINCIIYEPELTRDIQVAVKTGFRYREVPYS